MKKNTSKSTKSPAPATSKSAPPAKSGITAKPFVGTKTTPPLPVKSAPQRVQTTITALIDIGFGNRLFVRGEGAGLSWDQGTPLDCVADDKWSVSLGESNRPLVFKFLINDLSWSVGEDYTVAPGTSITVTPVF